MFWTILVIFAIVILLFMMRRRAAYKKLFADEHFLEIAEGIKRMKEDTLANIEQVDEPQNVTADDPRLFITSQNLLVYYTVVQNESSFKHHFSISIAGGYTATAVGEIFSLYVAHLLGFNSQKIAVERSQHSIYHVEWHLTQKEQEVFAQRAVKIPTREELPDIYARLDAWRSEVFSSPTRLVS